MNELFTELSHAQALDQSDALNQYRNRFKHPRSADGTPRLYFCGHSLGLQPANTRDYLLAELDQWEQYGVRGHFTGEHPWMPYHEFLTPHLATLVGAQDNEVVCMNSLTANLHLMMVSFYKPTQQRYKIMIEADAFPSDRYAVMSQLGFHGQDPATALVELRPKPGDLTLRTEDILDQIEAHQEELALILLPGVQYYTGQVFNMPAITEFAHHFDIPVGLDLAHAAGNVPLSLHDWQVDFACWCHYKYLNSGPGAVAGCFVHEKHATNPELIRFAGWWGHDKSTRFSMPHQFQPMLSAESWQLSNPPIFSLCAIRASLEMFSEVGLAALRQKSVSLTNYLEQLLLHHCQAHIDIITPAGEARGCQLSIQFKNTDTQAIHQQLTDRHIDCDFRHPNVIRIAPVPFYNTYADVWQFVNILQEVLQ